MCIRDSYLCVGYEMDEGMHGPTMGFTNRVAVIILNDGKNERLANGLADYIKDMVGAVSYTHLDVYKRQLFVWARY